MNNEQFTKLVSLFDERQVDSPEAEYDATDTKVTAQLSGELAASFNKIATIITETNKNFEEIKDLKEAVTDEGRKEIAALFDLTDVVLTRQVETEKFVGILSKDPERTARPKYKEILEEIEKHLTPELLELSRQLKKTWVTETQQRPAIKLLPREVKEAADHSQYQALTQGIYQWADSFDQDLIDLIKKSTIIEK